MPTNINYVKFMRGSQSLYDNLATKDKDTLYFVYNDISDEYGKLYLGNKLISGFSNNNENISITDIANIVLDANLSDGDILAYDEAEGKWTNTSLEKIADLPDVMTGATAETHGASGLVPMPEAGDQFSFLRGDGTWATPDEESSSQVASIQSTLDTLVNGDEGKSTREIAAEELASQLIPENASEDLNTLKKIADWIQGYPERISTTLEEIDRLKNRVKALEDIIGSTFVPEENKYTNVSSAVEYFNSVIDNKLRWEELSSDAAIVDEAVVDISTLSE